MMFTQLASSQYVGGLGIVVALGVLLLIAVVALVVCQLVAYFETRHPAGSRYKKAYDLHHKCGQISDAVDAYNRVIKEHPESPEADYSRDQLRTINSERDVRESG